MRAQIWIILFVVTFSLPAIYYVTVFDIPPKACTYLVPVAHHPGVLKCARSPQQAKR